MRRICRSNSLFWSCLLFVFFLLVISCGGGGSGDNSVSSQKSMLPLGDSGTEPEDDQLEYDDDEDYEDSLVDPKVIFVEGSQTWPVGSEMVAFEKGPYVSETENPLGPWLGRPVLFKGVDSGGADLIYRYKLEFDREVEISSIQISGDAWGTLRLLDRESHELKAIDLQNFALLLSFFSTQQIHQTQALS